MLTPMPCLALLLTGPTYAPTADDLASAHPPDPSVLPISLHDDQVRAERVLDVAVGAEPTAQTSEVIFLNYDGAQLSRGRDDARSNVSQVCAGTYPAWGNNPSLKEAILQAVHQDWEAYDVLITTSRPASGSYTMAMIGPAANLCGAGGAAGIAPVDCDNENRNSVVFSFTSAGSQFGANGEATVYSQEIAHSYGLEHVQYQPEIMNPLADGTNQRFIDQCYPITGNSYCNSQHAANCGSGQQNSHRELLRILGEAIPDLQPPAVVITYPADGDRFGEGADFDITADATDDRDVEKVELLVGGSLLGRDSTAPYGWKVSDIPAGSYALVARATDRAGNAVDSATVTIQVGASSTSPGSGEADADGDAGDESGGTDTDVGENAPGGCGCRAAPAPGFAAALVVLVGGIVARRRRH